MRASSSRCSRSFSAAVSSAHGWAKQQRDYQTKLRSAAAEYEALAADRRDQFTNEGMPLRNSRAAKLRVVLEGAKTSRLPAMVAASDRRIEQIEGEQRAWVGDNAAALALREWRRGFEAVARVRALAREMFAAVSEAQHGYHVLMSIVSGTSGSALDGRSIEVDARLDQLADLLGSLEGLKPPRVRAFTPHPGKHVTVVPTRDGGWVHAQYADRAKAGLAPEPERVERPT